MDETANNKIKSKNQKVESYTVKSALHNMVDYIYSNADMSHHIQMQISISNKKWQPYCVTHSELDSALKWYCRIAPKAFSRYISVSW